MSVFEFNDPLFTLEIQELIKQAHEQRLALPFLPKQELKRGVMRRADGVAPGEDVSSREFSDPAGRIIKQVVFHLALLNVIRLCLYNCSGGPK